MDLPKGGSNGVRPSLLPRHRGATPIQNEILSGDTITGVTLYTMDEKVDHGPILAGKELAIEPNDTYETLSHKLASLSAELLISTIPNYIAGNIKPQVQNETYATYTKKFSAEDARVDLEHDDPLVIERRVRALNPEPGVWTIQNNKRMKILEAEMRDGKLKLKKIQMEGKTPQTL